MKEHSTRREQIEDKIRRALRGCGICGRKRTKLIEDMRALAMIGGCAERERTLGIVKFFAARQSDAIYVGPFRELYERIIVQSIEGVWDLPLNPNP